MQVALKDVIQVATPVLLAVVGWGVRLVWSEIRDLRSERKEYVLREQCRFHREGLERQLKALSRQSG